MSTQGAKQNRTSRAQTVGVISLGCPKNLTDSEVLMGHVQQAGHTVTADVDAADTVIVNTCSFLQASVDESFETIREVVQRKQSGGLKRVLVAGCLVERYREALLKALPEVDGFIGSGALHQAGQFLTPRTKRPQQDRMKVGDGAALYVHDTPRVKATYPWTAYVKIAEGCDHTCAFCTIPSIRGKFRSRRIESVVQEVELLAARGVKEINLVAQDATMYGLDVYGTLSLDRLLTALAAIPGIVWIRVLYGYPTQLTDGVIETLRTSDRVARYFDMPIQHVSTRVLRAMKRGYGKEKIQKIVRALRDGCADFALRTTVIVGFPGEEEKDVQELLEMMDVLAFDQLGAFVYSREPGTPAACLEEQVAEDVKTERYHRVMAHQQKIAQMRSRRWVGRTLSVLVEEAVTTEPTTEIDQAGGAFQYRGRSFRDAPEIDGATLVTATQPLALGSVVPVTMTQAEAYDLWGRHVP